LFLDPQFKKNVSLAQVLPPVIYCCTVQAPQLGYHWLIFATNVEFFWSKKFKNSACKSASWSVLN